MLLDAIDSAKRKGDDRISWLHRFPTDCCDHTSNLMFLHLDRCLGGHHSIDLIRGEVQTGGEDTTPPTKHVWVEVDGFTVDITADQFGQEPVIVLPFSPWHRGLREIARVVRDHYQGDRTKYIQWLESHGAGKWYAALCSFLSEVSW